MINKFETNPIVFYFYFTGGYIMHLKPPVMFQMSNILCLVSHATFQPFPNRNSYGPAIFAWYSPYPMCHVSRVTCQVSHVTCDVSCVTCDMSHVIWHIIIFLLFLFYKLLKLVGEGSVINGAYLFWLLEFWLLKRQWYPFPIALASGGPFRVIKKANW